MELLKEYVIQFIGLSLGHHTYDYTLDNRFFAHFEHSEIQKATVKVILDLEKQERMLILNFNIEGVAELPCDRCGDEFDILLKGKERLFVKFGSDYHEESEEVLIIPQSEHQINVSELIYEYVHLLLPIQRIHPDDSEGNNSCNPDALNRLDALRPTGLTNERWDVLKNIQLD